MVPRKRTRKHPAVPTTGYDGGLSERKPQRPPFAPFAKSLRYAPPRLPRGDQAPGHKNFAPPGKVNCCRLLVEQTRRGRGLLSRCDGPPNAKCKQPTFFNPHQRPADQCPAAKCNDVRNHDVPRQLSSASCEIEAAGPSRAERVDAP